MSDNIYTVTDTLNLLNCLVAECILHSQIYMMSRVVNSPQKWFPFLWLTPFCMMTLKPLYFNFFPSPSLICETALKHFMLPFPPVSTLQSYWKTTCYLQAPHDHISNITNTHKHIQFHLGICMPNKNIARYKYHGCSYGLTQY